MAANKFTLTVKVAQDQLSGLKGGGFKLCIAKKVNDVYTVICIVEEDFNEVNDFEWTEEYQVFMSKKFDKGMLVAAATTPKDIQFGQTCLFDEEGILHPAAGPVRGGSFFVDTRRDGSSVGVTQKFGKEFLPIFVSPTTIAGIASCTPVTAVSVWFQTNAVTKTMIYENKGLGMEVIYAGANNKVISYRKDKDAKAAQWYAE